MSPVCGIFKRPKIAAKKCQKCKTNVKKCPKVQKSVKKAGFYSLVLISAHTERVGVSHMKDFSSSKSILCLF